jgi:hypothetical protein
MFRRKNIRTEISPRDLPVSRTLNEGPPIGLEQQLLAHPVRNRLLGDAGVPESAHLRGESSLAPPSDDDRSLQSRKVTFLHGHPKYTNRFVLSTTPFVSHEHKEVCKVLDMAQSRSVALKRPVRPAKLPKEKREALPGLDGKTLGQRVSEAMAYKSGRLGYEYRPVDLLADVNRLAHATPNDPFLSQQMLSAILTNKVTKTSKTPFIAMACGVSIGWLVQGVGKMTDTTV